MRLPFKIEKKGRERYAESRRHLRDIGEAQIALAALDGSHERPVDAAFIGKRFLRIALFRPKFPDPLAESPEEPRWKIIFHTIECLGYDVITSTVFT